MKNNIALKKKSIQFVVSKRQIGKNKTLKTSILYDKVEHSALQSVVPFTTHLTSSLKSFELDILQQAYLNDKLIITNNIQKLSNSELELRVTVVKKLEQQQDIICKAVFGYALQEAS